MNRSARGMIKNSAFLFVLIFFASGVQAAEDVKNSGETVTEFEIAPYASYIQYKEPGLMKETGFMAGAAADFNAHLGQGPVLGLDGSFGGGLVDYESDGTGTVDNIGNFMFELRGTLGYDFWMGEDAHRLTPYAGFGYRFLRDNLGGETSSTGALGYDRESNYIYLPIGLKTVCDLKNSWKLGLNAEYDIFLDGTQKSELGDAISGLDTVEHDQNKGYGLRGSVSLMKKMESFNLLVKPYIRYWSIKQSDTKAITFGGTPIGVVSYEPKNTSTEIGVMVGIRY